MSIPRYRVHGSVRAAETSTQAAGELVSIQHVNSLTPGRARDGVSGEIEVAGDEVVRIVLDDDFVLWGRVDDIVQEYGRQAVSRDGGRAVEFDRITPMRVRIGGMQAERGIFGTVVKALEFFGVSLKKDAASKLGVWLEDRLLGDHPPALYRCSLDDGFSLPRLPAGQSIGAEKKPVLVFIHGTASSAEGSFGKLWEGTEAKAVRDKFKEIYDDRVYAFQHRTLTESPIANALELLKRIEPGADVHLVSHSRGGMVGELLCLSGCADLRQTLTDKVIDELFKTDRTLAAQIGLSPLDEGAKKKRDEAYDADKARLKQLNALIEERKIRVARFVRVACPARGTTLASGRLDRWFSMLNFVAQKATGNGLFGDSLDFILAVTKERTDPRTLPGLEAMMPGSALTRLLQYPLLTTRSDLSVIAGDIEGESIWGRLKLLAADWFYDSDHDLVVNTGSMFGGLRRDAENARFLQDKGASVSHFSYFANERSVGWLLKGLAREDGDSGGFAPIAEAKHEAPRWREAVARSREIAAPRPIAIVLPGIMGSALEARMSSVWLNLLAIAVGRLDLLRYGSKDVVAVDLLTDFYGPLLEFLAATHRVEILPYDWRLSVTAAAEKLADLLELQRAMLDFG